MVSSAAVQIALLLVATMSAATAPQPAPDASVDPAAAAPQVVVPSDSPPAPGPAGQPARAATPAVAIGAPALQHRWLVLPFAGYQKISAFRDRITAEAGTFSDGIRFGVIAGGRVNRFVSLNGGLGFDTGNQSPAPEGYHGDLSELHLGLYPLLHLGPEVLQLVGGPMFGLVWGDESSGNGNGGGPSAHWFGVIYGGELGVFFRAVPALALGALLAIDVVQPASYSCEGIPECPILSYPPQHTLESLTLALLF